MIPHIHFPTNPFRLPHTPELIECRSPVDRWLIYSLRLIYIVRSPVGCYCALFGGSGGRVICAEGLDDVVFD